MNSKKKARSKTRNRADTATRKIKAGVSKAVVGSRSGEPKTPPEVRSKRVSALDAAAQILSVVGKPMRAQELIDAMAQQELWKSPAGKTPHATLYAAMLREISAKGRGARFRKVDRGTFEAVPR